MTLVYGSGIKRVGWAYQRPGGGETNVWLTPQSVLDALGPFDLDPCACEGHPTRCAPNYFTESEDGLRHPWFGLVFCNPPYGKHLGAWLGRCATHGNAIALVPARTDTRAVNPLLSTAHLILFPLGRFYYLRPCSNLVTRAQDENATEGNGGSPPMILAWGALAYGRLQASGIPGAYLEPVTSPLLRKDSAP